LKTALLKRSSSLRVKGGEVMNARTLGTPASCNEMHDLINICFLCTGQLIIVVFTFAELPERKETQDLEAAEKREPYFF